MRLRTASSVNVSPASAGPRPSCRSRRMRRRSSSRSCDDALPRQLELLREPHCVNRGGNLRREVGDQAVVALTQALAGSRCEPELADDDPLMDERKREDVGARRAVLGAGRAFRKRRDRRRRARRTASASD